MKRNGVFYTVIVLVLIFDTQAFASLQPIHPEEITVTAEQTPHSTDEIGSQVTIITAREIELTQRRDLSSLLSYAPGLNMVRTGGPGGTGSIFMRGLNANDVKLRLDGMDINDPSTPAGAFDPAQFLTDGLQKVEILRGPQSGLYGADAMAGVIDMTTRKGKGPFRLTGRVEGGAYSTSNQTASFSGESGQFHYFMSLSHNHTGIYQAVPDRYRKNNPEKTATNRNDNRTATMRFDYDITQAIGVTLTAHLTQADYEFEADRSPPPDYVAVPSNERDESNLNQAITRGELHMKSFHGLLEQRIGLGYVTYRRRDETAGENDIAFNRGDRLKADWHGLTHLGRNINLLAGYDYIRERLIHPSHYQTTTHAGYAQLDGQWRHIILGAANIRYDDNSRYGHYVTWRLAPAIRIPQTGLTLKASGGTGFHGPSLNQLFVSYPDFNSFSNPHLKAEKLIGFDSGFEEHIFNHHLIFGGSYYENHVHNLINYTYVSSIKGYSYLNMAKAKTRGVEAFVTLSLCQGLKWQASYGYTLTKDLTGKAPLLRRPKHKMATSLVWSPLKYLDIVPSVLYVSSWHDTDRYNFTTRHVPGYVTFDLAAQYKLTRFSTFFIRADNLADNHYENPSGYWQPRRSFYGGVTIDL